MYTDVDAPIACVLQSNWAAAKAAHKLGLGGCSGKAGAKAPAFHLNAKASSNMQHAGRPHVLHTVIPRVERLLQVCICCSVKITML